MYAYNHYGTAVGDAMFNMVANGVSVGAINAGLAGLAGEDYENMGAMAGGGFLAGGFIPTGQQGMKAGKTNFARDTASIDAHMKNKLTEDQRKAFVKMPRPAQVMLSTLQEAGIGSPKFMIMEPKAYLDFLNESRRQNNLPELDRAPKGHFDKPSRTIYINESNLPQSSRVATELIAHETGHDFIYRAIGDDPTMLQLLLEPYRTKEGKGTAFHYRYDDKGNPLGDPIYLDDTAVAIQRDYDSKQRGRPATSEDVAKGLAQREGELIGGISIGKDASKLAQEIGAEQFAMMFTKDPNAFENFHPRLRRYLLDSSRRLLGILGVVEPSSGNPLSNPISKAQLDNPSIRRIYENYGRARAIELDEKGQLAKKGMLIQPKKGQTGEDRFVELFGGNGLSLTDAKNLVISNKSLRREIDAMKKRYKENPEDGWSTTKRGFLIGKKLTNDLRTIFTRNDPFRNVATILNALQEAIDQRVGIVFGYRSGTKSKRQNPFRIRDVAIYGWQVSAGTLKVLGYDQAVVRQNMQTLVEKGYVKDIKDFEKRLAEQGQKALADPEGRINPEGRKENEIMTVAFGLKESAGEIASPGLRDLLESGVIKKSFKSFDVEALAGIRRGEKKAFAFDYENIRNNYNPFRQSEPLFQPSDKNTLFSPEGDPKLPPTPAEVDSKRFASYNHLGLRDNILDGALETIKQFKFSGQQFMSALTKFAGAKNYADEIGLTDFLQTKKSFDRQEIERFIKRESPVLQRTDLGESTDIMELRDRYYESEIETYLDELDVAFSEDDNGWYIDLYGEPLYGDFGDLQTYGSESDARAELQYHAEQMAESSANNTSDAEIREVYESDVAEDIDGDAVYPEYATDGGENYRETLIKFGGDEYIWSDPHFSDENNVVAHIRSNIRQSGETFFIEEIQSDWHQTGRSEGYDNSPLEGQLSKTENGEYQARFEDGRQFRIRETDQKKAYDKFLNLKRELAGGVPDAPFKKSWPSLALKTAIKDAVNRGVKKVAWLGGQGHLNRYPSLVKKIKSIHVYTPNKGVDNVYSIEVSHEGSPHSLLRNQLLERDLKKYIGKTLTERAVKDLREKRANADPNELKFADTQEVYYTGLDMEFGGDGMKNFYDKELVSLANKISKKIGGGKVQPYTFEVTGGMDANRRPWKREYRGWSFELPADKSKIDDLMLYMPDSGKVSDNSIPLVAKEVSKKSKTGFNPQELLKRAGYKSADEVRTETLANDLFSGQVRSEREATRSQQANRNDQMFMPALEDAKAIVREQGRVAESAEDAFFGSFMPKLLRKTKGQLKASVRNIREATRRAIEDVTPFMRENPQFADYYNKDMEASRRELNEGYGNVTDDDFLYYQTMLGLTSPGTKLPSNVGDGVNIFNLYKEKGDIEDIKMGTSEKGNPVIASSPFKISGTTAPTKARSLLIVDKLRKKLGSVRNAIDYLEEAIPMNELHKFNKKMGYAGNVAKTGDIRRIVKQATGQDELIPRMFIFGPKVGAYTLNTIGNHNYNTIDVWEARFIRSYFKGMFKPNTGLPANVDEHALFTRFTEIFQEEFETKTKQKMPTSALQAIRWFYMISTAKELGYSGASTNETISGYTKRYVTKLRANKGGRGQGNGTTNEGVRPKTQNSKGQSKGSKEIEQFMPDDGDTNRMSPSAVNQNRFMAPAMSRSMATSRELDRFRN